MRFVWLVAAIAFGVAPASSRGATVRVSFAGHVSGFRETSDVSDPAAAIGGSIQVGTPFSGYFSFDDAAPPNRLSPGDPNEGFPTEADYRFRATDWAYHTEVGAFVTDVSPDIPFPPGLGPPLPGGYNIGLNDWELSQFRPDEVIVGAQVGELPAPGGPIVGPVYVYLGLTGGALDEPLHSPSLSSVPWSLSAFSDPNPQVVWRFLGGGGRIVEVLGALDSLAVPEPSPDVSIALAGAVLAVVAALRQGYRRARS